MKRFAAALAGLAALACSSVPTLVFVDGSVDAGRDGATDATAPDADKDAASGCPGTPPDGASCCGAVACQGVGCGQGCAECEMKCAPTQLCCPNPAGKVQACLNGGVCP